MGSKRAHLSNRIEVLNCSAEDSGHLRCNPCWPIIVTGIMKGSSAPIFRVKQCNMSGVPTPEDASTTILPNTPSIDQSTRMDSSIFLLFLYLLLMPWKLFNLMRIIFLNEWCSTNVYLLLLISFPGSLPNCIRVQDFKMLVHWPT